MRIFTVLGILVVMLLICGMGYRQVERNEEMYGITVDTYEAEVLGQYGKWSRSVKKPYPIVYLEVKTSDGHIHKLRNIDY
jgi:hypothetical protein